ncbi:MAG: hypothetical protein RLZZ502_1002 [Pseudomonadota bacterium]|jgi:RND family efflux transporter MFP subunit
MRLASCVAVVLALAGTASLATEPKNTKNETIKPALTVAVVKATKQTIKSGITANGNLAAWQEASVGAELSGLRVTEVRANVGDVVKRGQVLAVVNAESIDNEIAQAQAQMAEVNALLTEARANLARSENLQKQGFISPAQLTTQQTAVSSSEARLNVGKAALANAQLRRRQANVLAPDAGIITQRLAAVGAVTSPGQELFRLIRQGRLEWRAEVNATDLPHIQIGSEAMIRMADGTTVAGKVRQIAPTVDMQSRNAIVYVDVKAHAQARAGLYVNGTLQGQSKEVWVLPQAALLVRDGFHFVMKVDAQNKVSAAKVNVGQRLGDWVEILGGLAGNEQLVASGSAFLNDGDTVKVSAQNK